MQNPKIIFFDIDETLYRKHTDTVRPSISIAMQALKERGILTAIATGRAEANIPLKIKQVIEEAQMDLLITINGQFVRYQGEVIEKRPLVKKDMAHMIDFFENRNIAYAFVNQDEIVVSDDIPVVVNGLTHIAPNYKVDKNFYQYQDVYQMLAFYGEDQDKAVDAEAAKQGYKTVRWHETAVDMLDIQGSKARAIRLVTDKLGIDMKDVMAFGDGLNDIEMMKIVGFGVAMGNGRPELKAISNYVCSTVEKDGVLNGLKNLGII